jgi:hypothetical protein
VLGAIVVLGLLVGADAAAAAPRLWIENVVSGDSFGRGGRCFAAGSTLAVGGEGFVPGVPVHIGKRRVKVGHDGGFGFLLDVRSPMRAQEVVRVRARQLIRGGGRARTPQATLRLWSALRGVDVPGWNTEGGEARGVPGKVERAAAGGFDWGIGRALYVHYLLNGRQVFAQHVATLRGPCGAADFRLIQFPFPSVAPGLYRVDFGTRPTVDRNAGAGYRAVRIGAPPPPLPQPTTPLFTIAGQVDAAPGGQGVAATTVGLDPYTRLAARPDGSLLLADSGRVRLVEPNGLIRTVAGTGRPGFAGDGGPAVAARVSPTAVAALPDGGFLMGQCDERPDLISIGRVRRVAADGTITTIAGNGRAGGRFTDGAPATATSIGCPADVVAASDGSVVVAEERRVLRISPDGAIRRIAGNGEVPEETTNGGPALRSPLMPADLAPLPDGSLLIADSWACHVYRLAGGSLSIVAGDGSEGRRRDDGARAVDASVCPDAIAAAPGGGFYVADNGFSRATGSEPRLRIVVPDGRIVTVAGTGRFSPDPPRGGLRGDGAPGPLADLRPLHDVAVLPDGGVAFTEGQGTDESVPDPGLVRYLPPPSGGLFAAAVRRDRDRLFTLGRPAAVTISLTAPAEVTLTISDGERTVASLTRALGAGDTRIALPPLESRPLTVIVAARDGSGRVSADRAALLPRGWLSDNLARSLASALVFSATDASSSSGNGYGGCRRFGPSRVDCSLIPEDRCDAAVTLRLGADRVVRWGTYQCPIARGRRLRKALRPLRRRDYSCEASDTSCPPPLLGPVDDRWLVPWG